MKGSGFGAHVCPSNLFAHPTVIRLAVHVYGWERKACYYHWHTFSSGPKKQTSLETNGQRRGEDHSYDVLTYVQRVGQGDVTCFVIKWSSNEWYLDCGPCARSSSSTLRLEEHEGEMVVDIGSDVTKKADSFNSFCRGVRTRHVDAYSFQELACRARCQNFVMSRVTGPVPQYPSAWALAHVVEVDKELQTFWWNSIVTSGVTWGSIGNIGFGCQIEI